MDNHKLPPQNIEVEEIVLGAILMEYRKVFNIIELFNPEAFYSPKNKLIAEAIITVLNQSIPVDLITVSDELRKTNHLEEIGGVYYLSTLTTKVGSASNLEHHFKLLIELSIKRNLGTVAGELFQKSFETETDAFELIDDFEQNVNKAVSHIVTDKIESSAEIFSSAMDQVLLLSNRKDQLSGVYSGLPEIDDITGGWQNSDLIILAARPGMGKSALAAICGRNAAVDKEIPILIFSLEMKKTQIMSRLMAAETDLYLDKFIRSGLTAEEQHQVTEVCGPLKKAPIYIDDTGAISMFHLRNKCRKMKREKKIGLIIIDYLQLMTSGRKTKDKNEEVSIITANLKALAKELDVPIIALSQLSREVEKRAGKIPQLSDLRDSGSIEQDADIVIFLYRPEYYDITTDEEGNDTKGKAMVIIAKHRSGSTGMVAINFHGPTTKFYSPQKKGVIEMPFQEIKILPKSKQFELTDDAF